MEELKKHQPPMTIDEQIENLKGIGLIVDDEDDAKRMLNNVSYFRLIKGYSLNLKSANGIYNEQTTFNEVVALYLFNTDFRQMIFPEIEAIEIHLRCRVANYFAEHYGVLGYLEHTNFENETYHQQFIREVENEVKRNSKAPMVRHFRERYVGGQLPIYALVEILSFGTLSKFYKNMHNEDKKAIAQTFGVGYTYFASWIESISYVRNICAHYGRLYNAKLTKTPKLYKEYRQKGIDHQRIFGVLLCMKELLKKEAHWQQFVDNIEALFEKYGVVQIETMGFTEDWKVLLLS